MTRLISCRKCGKVGPKATCDACALPVKRERARVREQSRPTPSQRGYGTDWRRLRAAVLERDGHCCQDCGTDGRPDNPLTADHVLAKSRSGTDEPSNLPTRCKRCHGHKTARDQRNGLVEW